MDYKHNKSLVSNARALRKNLTKEERHLWYDFLRYCRPRFRRQEIIGNYIADFYCHQAKLAIELDGSQHTEPEAIAYDRARTAFLQKEGYRVLRISNLDVWKDFRAVCEAIHNEVQKRLLLGEAVTEGD